MKRRKMGKTESKVVFTKNAVRTDRRNLQAVPMRGGFRI